MHAAPPNQAALPIAGAPTDTPHSALATSGTSQRDYWIAQCGGWGLLTLVSVLSSSFGDWRNTLSFAAAKTMCMLAGMLMSHLWRGHLRQRGWLERPQALPLRPMFAWLLTMSLGQTGVLCLSDMLFRDGRLFRDDDNLPLSLLFVTLLWLIIFMIWTLCYAVALSRRRAVRDELEKLQLAVSAKDAELRALQAQTNPHFFFNSLNSIRALIYQDSDAAAMAVSQLAGMMRHHLQSGQSDTVQLVDELRVVNAYLSMEKLRFEQRLQLSLDIEPGLDAIALPPMILQTLAENAVKHGVERSTGPCQIRIAARREAGRVVLRVSNQGKLATASASTRLGLANAAKRLELLFGPQATCTLAEEDGWVVARVVLPQEAA